MFTLVAWHDATVDRARHASLDLVEAVVGLDPATRSLVVGQPGTYGLCVWDPAPRTVGYPRFSAAHGRGVATLGAPLGVVPDTVCDDVTTLPLRLADTLVRSDEIMEKVAPPFALVDCRPTAGLAVYTDGLGMARIYQAERNGLWAWSNRPAVLAALGAAEFEEDVEAWSAFAACGWFTGMRSPIVAVRRLAPGAVITTSPDGRVRQRISGVLSSWVQPRHNGVDHAAAARAMVRYIRDAASLTDRPVQSMLSGGRDSRVVSAATVVAGVEATFTTIGPLRGEVDTALRLVQALGKPINHNVREPSAPSERPELASRILRLHRSFDGDLTPIKMNSPPGLTGLGVTLGGAGGEIAHGNYYPSQQRLDALRAAGGRAPVERLQKYFRSLPGATEEGYARLDALVETWAGTAHEAGIHGVATLDFFYLVERFRRWVPAANTPGSYPAFAVPEFISAAFQLEPAERVASSLHRSILRYLIPSWADIPFYKASGSDQNIESERIFRIWQGQDAAAMAEILDSPDMWTDVFQAEDVNKLWRTARSDGLPKRFEAMFQRVAWRALFRGYLADLRGRAARHAA